MRFDRNDYSVPTAYAHHEVTVLGGIDDVAVTSGTNVIARHPRHWGKEHTTFDPIHYLALLERKPGAIDFARPLEHGETLCHLAPPLKQISATREPASSSRCCAS